MGSAASLQSDRRRLAASRRLRSPPPRAPRSAPRADEGRRSRRAGIVRGREHPLRHRIVPRQLEVQHQHPLRRRARRRRADPLRDRRLRSPMRQDRSAVDGGSHPSGHHLAVGRRRCSVHGRTHGGKRRRRAEGVRGTERTDWHRQPRHARARSVSTDRADDRQRVADRVEGPNRQDARRSRAVEAGIEHRRRRDVEDQVRVAEAGRARARDRSQGARVHARARLRDHLRHHRRLGRQHEPVPPLGDRQADSPGRSRHRRHQRRRAVRLLHRLRALLQMRWRAGHEDDAEGSRPLSRGVRLDVRRPRQAASRQHHRRRRGGVSDVRR